MWDLTIMTEESQSTIAFLLMLPLGAFITAVFNGIVGLRTIGIFTPTILALNQAKSDWRIGLVIFAVTFTVGSLGRKLLIRTKLSTITRRGIIATVTVLALTVLIVINERMRLGLQARSVILPVVILTLIIDRFHKITESEGSCSAVIILANTILVTFCCFLVFAYSPAEQIILRNVWLELVVLCGLICLGTQVTKPLFTIPAKIHPNKEKGRI